MAGDARGAGPEVPGKAGHAQTAGGVCRTARSWGETALRQSSAA